MLEVQWMERTAYEIALEARTPITLAMSAMQRAVEQGIPLSMKACDRMLKLLHRAQHSFTKLAMYNMAVRESRGAHRIVDVIAEAHALRDSLPPEFAELIQIEWDGKPAEIVADRFQVTFVLETMMMFLTRYAPEDVPVVLHIFRVDERVHVHLEGFLPTLASLDGAEGSFRHDELRLALPLLMDYLAANEANYEERPLEDGRSRFEVDFAAAVLRSSAAHEVRHAAG
jgi:hypothetical protein